MKDEYALNDFNVALKRFYVVEDVSRAAEGFSQTWYPHLYRVKLKQIYDSQEFKEILDLPAEEGSSDTLRDVLSTYEKEMQINDAVIAQAEVKTILKSSGDNYKKIRDKKIIALPASGCIKINNIGNPIIAKPIS